MLALIYLDNKESLKPLLKGILSKRGRIPWSKVTRNTVRKDIVLRLNSELVLPSICSTKYLKLKRCITQNRQRELDIYIPLLKEGRFHISNIDRFIRQAADYKVIQLENSKFRIFSRRYNCRKILTLEEAKWK